MTYRDKLEELHNVWAEKTQELLKYDKVISETNGFGDMTEMGNYQKADKEFKLAANNFFDLFAYCRNNKIDFDSEFTN